MIHFKRNTNERLTAGVIRGLPHAIAAANCPTCGAQYVANMQRVIWEHIDPQDGGTRPSTYRVVEEGVERAGQAEVVDLRDHCPDHPDVGSV